MVDKNNKIYFSQISFFTVNSKQDIDSMTKNNPHRKFLYLHLDPDSTTQEFVQPDSFIYFAGTKTTGPQDVQILIFNCFEV